MAGVSRRHPTTDLFRRLGLLNIHDINKYMVSLFVFKCLHNEDFSFWFPYQNQIEHQTRSVMRDLLEVPRIYNVHSEQLILYRGPSIWNSICLDTRRIIVYNTLKLRVKKALLSNAT